MPPQTGAQMPAEAGRKCLPRPGAKCLPRPGAQMPPKKLCCFTWGALVDVIGTHDVILAEVAADLYLDQLQLGLAGVLQAMPLGGDEVDGLVLADEFFF